MKFLFQGAVYLPRALGNPTAGALFITNRLRLNTEQHCLTVFKQTEMSDINYMSYSHGVSTIQINIKPIFERILEGN